MVSKSKFQKRAAKLYKENCDFITKYAFDTISVDDVISGDEYLYWCKELDDDEGPQSLLFYAKKLIRRQNFWYMDNKDDQFYIERIKNHLDIALRDGFVDGDVYIRGRTYRFMIRPPKPEQLFT